ncbi:hypothetical protein AWC38_SpisGene2763 [Stylophora pistillata]|uniref:Uncharacterized protein n=1 Tax=Stylophora pistillata TaxID=50429 RepID=A0A2B4SUY2_STYPI|nr:hypothetical protein AWC38_SpisGene2763 [Stylophora pistillata]
MANKTGDSRSGPKRRRSSALFDPELPRPVSSSSRLDPTIETILRRTVRMRADAEKAYSSLQARIKFLETHAGQSTTPSGLRIKRIQAKGHNVDELQGKFDDIVRELELKLLEAAKDHLCAEVKVHQEAVRSTTANIEGTIARWKVELRKTDISEDQARSLCVAASAFAEELSKDSAVSRASKALQTEIDRKEKYKSLVNMDVSKGCVPSETSIREIVRNGLRLSSGTTNRVDTSRQRKGRRSVTILLKKEELIFLEGAFVTFSTSISPTSFCFMCTVVT